MTRTPITVHKAKEGLPAVTRVVVEREAVEPTFRIEMGLHDAQVLMLITCVIGGDPNGLRGTISRLHDALKSNEITPYGVDKHTDMSTVADRVFHSVSRNLSFKGI